MRLLPYLGLIKKDLYISIDILSFMGFVDVIKGSFGILLFKDTNQISKEKHKSEYGFLILVLAMLATSIIQVIEPFSGLVFDWEFVIGYALWLTIFQIIWFLILHGLSKAFGGKASAENYFGFFGDSRLFFPLTAVPFIGWIVGLYYLIIDAFLLHKIHELSWLKVILLLAVVFVAVGVLFIIGFIILVGRMFYFLG